MKPLFRLANILAALLLALSGLGPAPRAAAEPEPPVAPEGNPFFFPPDCVSNSSFDQNTVAVNIPDAANGGLSGVVTSTIFITSADSFLWRVIVNTNITHTASADIDMYLISPQGTEVTLTTDNGGDKNDVFNGTQWNDAAGVSNPPGPVTLNQLDNGVAEAFLAPEEPLSTLLGENPNGLWQLVVKDDKFGDLGRLSSWSLGLLTLPSAPPAIFTFTDNEENDQIPDDGTPLVRELELPDVMASLGGLALTTGIGHPASGDLVIEVVPPSGYTITLSSHNGLAATDLFDGTQWNDQAGLDNAPGPVTDNALVSGTVETPLAPQEPLGSAYYTNAGGAWLLVMRDTVQNGLVGNYHGASLSAQQFTCLPDLSVQPRTPALARLNVPVPIRLEVENLGGASGTVALTSTLPTDVAFLSADHPGWTCSLPPVGTLGASLYCSRASLDENTTSNITVTIAGGTAPALLGAVALTATTAGELNLTDNVGTQLVNIGAHSANQNPWDVNSGAGTGGMLDGGQDAFDSWGLLKLRVLDQVGTLLPTTTSPLFGFGLTYADGNHWHTTTPVEVDTLEVARSLYAPPAGNTLRYIDTFTNTGGANRTVVAGWGGDLGSDAGTLTTASSSGDGILTAADTWAVTIQPFFGRAGDPPLAYIFRSATDPTFLGPGIFQQTPFSDTWPSTGEDGLGFDFKFDLAPGETASLAYFVYRGLAEGSQGPQDCSFYADCLNPAAGSEVALAQGAALALADKPSFCDLTQAEVDQLVNWPGAIDACWVFLPVVLR